MSNGKPNILGKLPVYNDAGEIFDAGADKVHFEHKMKRSGDYARTGSQAKDEAKTKGTKKTTSKTAEKGSDPRIGGRSRPIYKRGGKSASAKGKGTKPALPKKGKK